MWKKIFDDDDNHEWRIVMGKMSLGYGLGLDVVGDEKKERKRKAI